MCGTCKIVRNVFDQARADPHRSYSTTLETLGTLQKEDALVFLAGDCPPEQAMAHLAAEQHYTVCHYFQCAGCGQIFLIGACIRGTPVYKEIKRLSAKDLRLLWGRSGIRFQKGDGNI